MKKFELIDEDTGEVLKLPATRKTFKGETVLVTSFERPKHAGSTGRVYYEKGETTGSFFPSVVGCSIQLVSDGVFEIGDIVKHVTPSDEDEEAYAVGMVVDKVILSIGGTSERYKIRLIYTHCQQFGFRETPQVMFSYPLIDPNAPLYATEGSRVERYLDPEPA